MNTISQTIIKGLGNNIGPAFFTALVREFDKAMQADAIIIAQIAHRQGTTLALAAHGDLHGNFSYQLPYHDAANLMQSHLDYYVKNLASMLGSEEGTRESNSKKGLAIAIKDNSGQLIGVIVALYRQDKLDHQKTAELFSLFSSRIAAELQHLQREQQLQDDNEQLLLQMKNASTLLQMHEKMASLGTLSAGVAHEINNPSNFVHAAVFMMQQQISDIKSFLIQLAGGNDAEPELLALFDEKFTKLIELAATALEGTNRIKDIVGSLRMFTRLDENEKQSVYLSELLASTVKLLKTQYNHIKVNTSFDTETQITCYPLKLGQVFMNLLINACHAIESRQLVEPDLSGVITVTTQQLHDVLIVNINDNGIGMSEEVKQRMFEPFFTTKQLEQGTGLGMAICQRIIDEHEGHIDIRSEPYQGCTLSVYLPLVDGREP